MCRFAKLTLILLFSWIQIQAQIHEKDLPLGKAHPKAPPQIKQMAFMIGHWTLDSWFAQADGSKRKAKATLVVRYCLDGMGIETIARYPPLDDGQDFVSVHTFVYNPRLKKIIGSGINTLGNSKSYEASMVDGNLVIIQSGMLFKGRSGINRSTYSNVKADSFEMVFDHSPDDGKTWQEGTFGYAAHRVKD